MKIACSVCVRNRELSNVNVSIKQKHVKSTLALCKHPKSEEYYIIHFTNQNKAGTRYNVKGNISQILTRFISEGKATIQFKAPPHDLYVHGDVIQLKGFLHLLKRVLEGKVSPKELTCHGLSVTAIAPKDMPVKKLVINSRSDYPAKGFPRTLEVLHITNIGRCTVDIGILKLTKLKVLDLSGNCIEFIPQELSLLNLSEINLSTNNLDKSTRRQWSWLSGNLSASLTSLNLESNNLEFLPDQILRLHKLVTLNVHNNKLKTLPQGIGCLNSLKFLIASNNSISVLPCSIKNRSFQFVNLFGNNFTSQVTKESPPKSLPVQSLKECAAQKALQAKLRYSSEDIPFTLVTYLDNAKYCTCGKATFDVFVRGREIISLSSIALQYVFSTTAPFLTIDCYFCSLKCYRSSPCNRNRGAVIR